VKNLKEVEELIQLANKKKRIAYSQGFNRRFGSNDQKLKAVQIKIWCLFQKTKPNSTGTVKVWHNLMSMFIQCIR